MEPTASAVPVVGDAVVGVFDRDDLGSALAATHRAGFGPHARVLDGARGDLAGQLRRAGLYVPSVSEGAATTALIVVAAPGRSAAVRDVLTRVGARAVHAIARGTTPPATVAAPAVPIPLTDAIADEGAAAGP